MNNGVSIIEIIQIVTAVVVSYVAFRVEQLKSYFHRELSYLYERVAKIEGKCNRCNND